LNRTTHQPGSRGGTLRFRCTAHLGRTSRRGPLHMRPRADSCRPSQDRTYRQGCRLVSSRHRRIDRARCTDRRSTCQTSRSRLCIPDTPESCSRSPDRMRRRRTSSCGTCRSDRNSAL
jgi:hypothetical protein